MNRRDMRRLLPALLLLMTLPAGAAPAPDAAALRKEIARHGDARWTALDEARWQLARNAFATLIARRGPPAAADRATWESLGYRLQTLGPDTRFALLPTTPAVAAEGVFLFDTAARDRHAVQAPHTRDDIGTADIALHLFFAGDLFAAMTSTTRRENVDLARAPVSLFTAFAAALATRPDARLLQLHGFEREKRTTAAGRSADSVTSGGHRWPAAHVLALRDCFSRELGGLHRVYGVDIEELGATQNASRARFPAGHDGFVHIELSRELRARLLADKNVRRQFHGCLLP